MLEPDSPLVRLADYTPPNYLIPHVELDIDLRDDYAVVVAALSLERNADAQDPGGPLVLNGEELELLSVLIDGVSLPATDYVVENDVLTIKAPPEKCTLETHVRIYPQRNTQLIGLYASGGGYFTQCEAEGFRRISYFLDRPDVMSRYTTTIHANRERYPVLLSNGNRIACGEEYGDRHWACWRDPFPKPAYLFAMVAADLDERKESFVTRSGREVTLHVFVEPGKLDQCAFALEALRRAMRWDEDTFGLELDLDQYMIVAVGDFNMGAMENKGLNIFNTKYVLARPDTATDQDYMFIDRVVAHEYFHNWTGNRVTCRDWFQLSLKEGLTVFRDQEYGADVYSRGVQRIQEVRNLRARQFPEDAGPMAHPVRPEAYLEISNFYTATVYDKGAEVVRMMHTLLGAAAFRRGMDLYFERHDGQAVCTEDFVRAMEDAAAVDLGQFQRWYSQAGTPVVVAKGVYDAKTNTYTLNFSQRCPPTPGQAHKDPVLIPIALALISPEGHEYVLRKDPQSSTQTTTEIVALSARSLSVTYTNIPQAPIPSLLRGFSAPVVLEVEYSDAELAHLLAYDSDPFNRWEAGQRLALRIILHAVAARRTDATPAYPPIFFAAIRELLHSRDQDPAFIAEALSIPAAAYVAEQTEVADPAAIHAARIGLRCAVASELRAEFEAIYRESVAQEPYRPDAAEAGRRALRNASLAYLMELGDEEVESACFSQLQTAGNMTDALAALTALANCSTHLREKALAYFYQKWQAESLVVDKWFAVQATSRLPDTLTRVQALSRHVAFDLRNPNRVQALVGAFCHSNYLHFHAADGSGYAFAAAQVMALDPLNPQVAARLTRAFDRWRKFDPGRQAHARAALELILAQKNLSKDTTEVVSRTLQAART